MKYKLGIFGSSGGNKMEQTVPKAEDLGRILGKHAESIVVVTGAGAGLPYDIAKEAASYGVEVWGFSDSFDRQDHQHNYPKHDLSIYTKLIFIDRQSVTDTPFADSYRARKKYRNALSTATCDAGIVLAGRWGSLNEFTNLVDMQKTVGILTGTGGIADELPALARKISKEGQGQIIFDDDPKKLVEALLRAI